MTLETHRLFIAVEIENQTCKDSLLNIQSLIPSFLAKKPSKDHMHITLKFLGDIKIDLIPSIKSALERVSFFPFDLVFNLTGAFPTKEKPRVLWVDLSKGQHELETLTIQINQILSDLGIEKERREFRPHMTLARIKKPIRQPLRALNEFYNFTINTDNLNDYTSSVTKFLLKKSTLTPSGPIYEDLQKINSNNN